MIYHPFAAWCAGADGAADTLETLQMLVQLNLRRLPQLAGKVFCYSFAFFFALITGCQAWHRRAG